MSDKNQVTIRSTKEQIFKAYIDAIETLEKRHSMTPVEEQKQQQKTKQVEAVKKTDFVKALEDLNQLKFASVNAIDELSKLINQEQERFIKLEQTIELEREHLDSLYGIKEQANSFASLILAHKQEEANFKANMQQEEELINSKLGALEEEYKERKTELEKQRKREEEEYNYNLKQARKIDQDKYEVEKQAKNQEFIIKAQELDNKEKDLLIRESRLVELETEVELLNQEIITKVANAEKEVTHRLESEFKFKETLLTEQNKRLLELNAQKIELLEQKLSDQLNLIHELNNKLQLAQEQTQSIAHKALETATSRAYVISGSPESVKSN